jgi:riboflavin synthase
MPVQQSAAPRRVTYSPPLPTWRRSVYASARRNTLEHFIREMFTGIVTAVGRVVRATPREKGLRLTIDAAGLDLRDVGVGDSIAVDGVCLTVVTLAGREFEADVSQETIDCTSGFAARGRVNLEKSLRLADRLGGHLVAGHVDGVGEVVAFDRVGENRRLVARAPRELAKYIARKGSITVQGVSLTVNRVEEDEFEINLIPHTLETTTLQHLAPGARVNLEVDLVARYVERMLSTSQ